MRRLWGDCSAPIIERIAPAVTSAMVLLSCLEHGLAQEEFLLDRRDFDRNAGFHRSRQEAVAGFQRLSMATFDVGADLQGH